MARMNLNGVEPEVAEEITTAAAGRGISRAEYLHRLVKLHHLLVTESSIGGLVRPSVLLSEANLTPRVR